MSERIYTKKGDGGETSLFGGPRVSKSDSRLWAYGTLDELNACLGMARAELARLLAQNVPLSNLDQELFQVQNYLFNLGSHLAVGEESLRHHLPAVEPGQVEHLEKSIDRMQANLPPLREFILPAGSELASRLHLARTICRRAERSVVDLTTQGTEVTRNIVMFLNRLSDYLFVAARYSNFRQNLPEVTWVKTTP